MNVHPEPLPDALGVAVAALLALAYLVPYWLWRKVVEPRLARRRSGSA